MEKEDLLNICRIELNENRTYHLFLIEIKNFGPNTTKIKYYKFYKEHRQC